MRIRVKAISIEDAVAQFIRKKIELEEEAQHETFSDDNSDDADDGVAE